MIKSLLSPAEFRRIHVAAGLLCLPLMSSAAHGQEAGFLEADQAFPLAVTARGGGRVSLQWQIAPGYYLYRGRMKVTAEPASSNAELALPPGVLKRDPNFGMVEVYHGRVRLDVTAPHATALKVVWQGCAEAGLCFPPQQRTVTLTGPAAPDFGVQPSALPTPLEAPGPAGIGSATREATSAPVSPTAAAGSAPPQDTTVSTAPRQSTGLDASEQGIALLLHERALLWTVPLFLLLGIGLAFTPCVLPMMPIVSTLIVGSRAGPRRAFALSLAFVLAMSAVYALLGIGAALAGGSLQAVLQNPIAIGASAALFAALSLSMFGWYELQLPALVRDRLACAAPRGGSIAGAAAMGALSALLVSPCMTAPLAGTLLYVAQTGNMAMGAALLFALGLGMGVPILVISVVGARALPRPGPWMNRVKGAFGFALLASAILMLGRVVAASTAVLLWGAWFTAVALTLWSLAAPGGARVLTRSAAVVAGLWGAAMVLGASAGATDPLQPLIPFAPGAAGRVAARGEAPWFETVSDPQVLQARLAAARAGGRPALVDFSADWCTSCKTIDREVFGDPVVRQALAGMTRLRADVTASDAAQQALMREHEVMGPPTVMLFDAQGHERRADRLVGEFTAAELLERLRAGNRG
jgi:thiol:disulfide interchange protein DsbD